MKTKVNGFEIEGTPQEVYAFIKLIDDARRDGVHLRPPLGSMPDWLKKECPDIYKTGIAPNAKWALDAVTAGGIQYAGRG